MPHARTLHEVVPTGVRAASAHPRVSRIERPFAAASSVPYSFPRVPVFPHGQPIQAVLHVSAPGDRFEREAEETARRVMRMEARDAASSAPPVIQRMCAACQEEEIHREAAHKGTGSSPHPAMPIDTLRDAEVKVNAIGGGDPLSREERAFFEPRFGVDFSRVRIHAGSAADEAARAVGALAYTRGNDIVFRRDSYRPADPAGRELLAHELTHVVQQGAAGASPTVQRALDEDGKQTFDPPRITGVPRPSTEEAERVGREALATMGYDEILSRALAAGVLKSPGDRSDTAGATPAPGGVQRQSFGAVFSRYAVAAGIASQVDSPAPGPGDVVALGILVVGLIVAATTSTTTTRVCPPCPTPPGPDIDRVPPSTPHFPCLGDHWHYYEYNQNPITCQCFGPRRLFGGCCGDAGAPC